MVHLILSMALGQSLNSIDRELAIIRTFWAVAWVESRGDPQAVNAREHAVGIVQIRPILCRDVNRILGRDKYTLDDRTNITKSFEMFRVYCRYYAPAGGPEQWARLWNSGPDWHTQTHLTDGYWAKVRAALQS